MSSKLLHLRSVSAGLKPSIAELSLGQIAINHQDNKLFIISADGTTVLTVADGNAEVKSVNSIAPIAGNVTLTAANIGAVSTTAVNAANGVAPLDSNGKIPSANLPDSILGGVNYQGTFIPGTTTLAAAASANKGFYYIATANGTYTPPSGTLLTFSTGDWLISNGSSWSVVDSQDAVTSVAGRTGVITLTAADIVSGTFASAQTGASAAANRVLTTDSSNIGTWVATVPTANLPVATAAALGVSSAGTGIVATAGVFSVNTTVLTMDEGTYSGT